MCFFCFRCKARVRTKANGKQLEIVERAHNHTILTERRKKGTLKAMYAQKKRHSSKKTSETPEEYKSDDDE